MLAFPYNGRAQEDSLKTVPVEKLKCPLGYRQIYGMF